MENQEFVKETNPHLLYGPMTLLGVALYRGLLSAAYFLYIIGETFITFFKWVFRRLHVDWLDVVYLVKIYGTARASFTLVYLFLFTSLLSVSLSFELSNFGIETQLLVNLLTTAVTHHIVPALVAVFLLVNLAKQYQVEYANLMHSSQSNEDMDWLLARHGLPQVFACLIVMVVSYFYALFAALSGEWLFGAYALGMSMSRYLEMLRFSLHEWNIIIGLSKVIVFAFFLSFIKIHSLFYTKSRSNRINRALINLIIVGIIGILFLDMIIELGFNLT